jgi:secreted trypsin-like serine protease
MRVAEVRIKSDRFANNRWYPEYVPAPMVAAGREGRCAAAGDSGGPLFPLANHQYTQIGIASAPLAAAASRAERIAIPAYTPR